MSAPYTTDNKATNKFGHSRDQDEGAGAFVHLCFLPLYIIMGISSIIGWLAAKANAPRGLVKLLTLPAWFIASNMVAVLFLIAGCFVIGLITGSGAVSNYGFSHLRDLTCGFLWGPIVTNFYAFENDIDWTPFNGGHVFMYQLAVYFIFGRWFANLWTNAVMLAAQRSG